MTKLFTYRFSDGTEMLNEPTRAAMDEMEKMCKEKGITLVYNGFTDHLSSLQLLRANSHKKKTDGFQPGWHPGLNMEIRTNGQYQEELKARGMIEVGNEKQRDTIKKKSVFTEDTIKMAVEMGAELTDREADKLLGKE